MVVVFVVYKNTIIRKGVEYGVRAVTGLALDIDKFKIGFIASDLHIQGLKLYNPQGFPDKVMLDIPEVYVDYDLISFLQKKIYIREARLYLKEFLVIKSADGTMNLDALRALQPKQAPSTVGETGKDTKAPEQEMPPLKIDVLKLKVDQVVYKEYATRGDPRIRQFRIFIDEEYRDIDDARGLVKTIVLKALGKTALLSLTNLDFGGVSQSLDGTVQAAGDITKGTVNVAEDAIKSTAQGIKDLIKLPFSKE